MSGEVSLSRMSDADFGGVLASLSPSLRLAVNTNCTAFVVQSSTVLDTPSGSVVGWVPLTRGKRFSQSLALFVAEYGSEFDGLAAAAAGLPDTPAAAAPEYFAARLRMQAAFDANDWRLDDYGRAVAQERNVRIVVVPDGSAYRLQLKRSGASFWDTLKITPLIDEVRQRLDALGRMPSRLTPDFAPVPSLVAECGNLPALACNGSWSELPTRPPVASSLRP